MKCNGFMVAHLLWVVLPRLSLPADQTEVLQSRTELLAYIEAQRKDFGDIEVRFSGSVRDLVPHLRSKPMLATKTDGIWRYRADGKQWLQSQENRGDRPSRQVTLSTADGAEVKVSGELAAKRLNYLMEMAGGGRPGMLFALLTLSDFWWPYLQRSAEVEGTEAIDGHRTIKFTFDARVLPRDGTEPTGPPRIARVWLDTERGGNVLRWEYHEPELGKGPTSRKRYNLVLVGDKWVPESCRDEIFLDPKGKLLATPAIVEEVSIDISTIQFNRGLRDDQLEAELPRGTVLDDQLTGHRSLVGGTPPTRDSRDAKKQLDELAAESQNQARQFRASYADRSTWWVVAVALFASGAIVGGIGLVRRRTKQA
jgi:hypothetical protein